MSTRTAQDDTVVSPLPNRAEQNGVEQFKPILDPADPGPRADEAVLDDFVALERATTLDGDEDDEPGAKEEISAIPVVSKLPKFSRFRSTRTRSSTCGRQPTKPAWTVPSSS